MTLKNVTKIFIVNSIQLNNIKYKFSVLGFRKDTYCYVQSLNCNLQEKQCSKNNKKETTSHLQYYLFALSLDTLSTKQEYCRYMLICSVDVQCSLHQTPEDVQVGGLFCCTYIAKLRHLVVKCFVYSPLK